MTRLLYLGFGFQPGLQAMFPGVNPAGHAFETRMVAALRPHFEIRSATTMEIPVPEPPAGTDPASGVPHDLILADRPPELFHRYRSLACLKRRYLDWLASGWRPESVLVYNLSPVYNNFLRWLKKQSPRSRLVLLLLDSSRLGQPMAPFKKFRHRFKPLVIPDDEMIGTFDGCIGLSQSAEKFFAQRKIPFLWMPGGCAPQSSPLKQSTEASGSAAPIRFGYFGALAPHSGVMPLIELFHASPSPAELHICGHGKLGEDIAAWTKREPRLKYHGLLPSPDDCLKFAQGCDVLVNPRPASHGNENNFPSKVFEYALCGRAILTSRLAGVDTVLGPGAYYFDPHNFKTGLTEQLAALSRVPRAELLQRGNSVRERVTAQYSWPRQASAMASFIEQLPTS